MSDRVYLRPIPHADPAQSAFADVMADLARRAAPDGRGGGFGGGYARWLAGGPLRFDVVETIVRGAGGAGERGPLLSPDMLPEPPAGQAGRLAAILRNLEMLRAPVAGLDLDRPLIMGVVNVTPDSFSDGGVHFDPAVAVRSALRMVEEGADILDIGGESTRPGSDPVPEAQERDRVLPVIEGLFAAGRRTPISIDTRKAAVARAALAAGARIFNDVSALSYDPESLTVAREFAARGGAVCLMHAQGDPKTMQDDPRYADVALDVYDYLEQRVAACAEVGIGPESLIVDPGIGFGKTLAHNLALIRGFGLFHGLGCATLLGASRKRFIGTLAQEPEAARRAPGSIAAALMGADQGAQILRVHDVCETAQALRVWRALRHDRIEDDHARSV